MNIQFKHKKKYYSISIGRETPWFSQIFLFCLCEEEYEGAELVYAKIILAI